MTDSTRQPQAGPPQTLEESHLGIADVEPQDIQRIVLCYPVKTKHLGQIVQTLQTIRDTSGVPVRRDIEVVDAGQDRIARELPRADVFIGHAKVPVDWDAVLSAGRLRFIQSSAAGLDHCLVPGVIEDANIRVCSAAGLFAPQVAEQTCCLLFGLLRRIHTFEQARPTRDFTRRPTDDLRGKTVGIVGLGGNGRMISKVLAPWDVRIIATDYFPESCPDEVSVLMDASRLDDLLAESDIVILTLPLNQSTRHLMNRSMLSRMRAGAYLINVARGAVVDETALVDALAEEHLAGVGVDVTEVEPLPPESPLWDHDRVLISPHVGAQSARRVDDTTDLACENLKRFFLGEALFNQVDKRLGFPHPSCGYRPGSPNPVHAPGTSPPHGSSQSPGPHQARGSAGPRE
ncbi:MAG: D-2-hydroxyacid dehydrogenase [Planctomycetota bacterium]